MRKALMALVLALFPILIHAAGRPALQPLPRAGVVVISWEAADRLDALGPVWYYHYDFRGANSPNHQRVYLVPKHFVDEQLAQAFRDHPGSWWLVGNEPNDPQQDNLTPATYAAFYHRALAAAGRGDASARIVPAGIANADWKWAEAFRESYRAQYGRYPRVAAWNIHDYILDPGTDQYDVDEFKRRIIAFRAWMARMGQADKPLLLTEYGVLYGSGCCGRPIEDPVRGIEFMRQTTLWLWQTDYVQAWAWFSLDSQQFQGDLFDASGNLSAFGKAYRDLARSLVGSINLPN